MADLTTSTWPELGPVDVVLIPLGSTEQHGPHLPFDTDAVIARAVAGGLADALAQRGARAVVAPALTFGSSGEHQDFPGTLSIGQDALTQVVIELARSAKTWAPRTVFVNGHGGNLAAVNTAVAQLVAEQHAASWVPCALADADAHAGREETSLMLWLAPEAVRLEQAEVGNTSPIAELLPELRERGVRAVSANGVLGNPLGASAEEGRRLLDEMVSSALARLDAASA